MFLNMLVQMAASSASTKNFSDLKRRTNKFDCLLMILHLTAEVRSKRCILPLILQSNTSIEE